MPAPGSKAPASFLRSWTTAAALLLIVCASLTESAPTTYDQIEAKKTDVAEYLNDPNGCYYNYEHYEEGDRIVTNEPCLNCTCLNRMLMCYLRVCPFSKAIGQDCTVQKTPDQCCPTISCPEVPVHLLTSSTTTPTTTTTTTTTSSTTEVGWRDDYGCVMTEGGRFFPDGAQVPSDPRKPCELCYCIRNRTACVMQQCTLHVEGCKPVYEPGVCCPVRYDCDYETEKLTTTSSSSPQQTVGGLVFSTTSAPFDCRVGGDTYRDGESIAMVADKPCQHCYCMRGDIVCAVQECGEPLRGKDCTPEIPPHGQCCPTSYQCANETTMATEPEDESLTVTTLRTPQADTKKRPSAADSYNDVYNKLGENLPGQQQQDIDTTNDVDDSLSMTTTQADEQTTDKIENVTGITNMAADDKGQSSVGANKIDNDSVVAADITTVASTTANATANAAAPSVVEPVTDQQQAVPESDGIDDENDTGDKPAEQVPTTVSSNAVADPADTNPAENGLQNADDLVTTGAPSETGTNAQEDKPQQGHGQDDGPSSGDGATAGQNSDGVENEIPITKRPANDGQAEQTATTTAESIPNATEKTPSSGQTVTDAGQDQDNGTTETSQQPQDGSGILSGAHNLPNEPELSTEVPKTNEESAQQQDTVVTPTTNNAVLPTDVPNVENGPTAENQSQVGDGSDGVSSTEVPHVEDHEINGQQQADGDNFDDGNNAPATEQNKPTIENNDIIAQSENRPEATPIPEQNANVLTDVNGESSTEIPDAAANQPDKTNQQDVAKPDEQNKPAIVATDDQSSTADHPRPESQTDDLEDQSDDNEASTEMPKVENEQTVTEQDSLAENDDTPATQQPVNSNQVSESTNRPNVTADNASPTNGLAVAADDVSPTNRPVVTEENESPTNGPAIAEDNVSPTNGPTVAEENASPTNRPAMTDDNTSPTNGPVVMADNALPTNGPAVAEENTSPTNGPAAAEENTLPTNGPAVAEENASPTNGPAVAADDVSPTNRPTVTEENASPTNGPAVAADNALSTNGPAVAEENTPSVVEENASPTNGPAVAEENVLPTNGPAVTDDNALPTNGPAVMADNASPINGPTVAEENTSPTNGPILAEENASPTNGPIVTADNSSPTNVPALAADNAPPTNRPAVTKENASPTNGPAVAADNALPTNGPAVAEENTSPINEPAATEENASPTNGPAVAEENASPTNGPVITAENASPTNGPAVADENASPTNEPAIATDNASSTNGPAAADTGDVGAATEQNLPQNIGGDDDRRPVEESQTGRPTVPANDDGRPVENSAQAADNQPEPEAPNGSTGQKQDAAQIPLNESQPEKPTDEPNRDGPAVVTANDNPAPTDIGVIDPINKQPADNETPANNVPTLEQQPADDENSIFIMTPTNAPSLFSQNQMKNHEESSTGAAAAVPDTNNNGEQIRPAENNDKAGRPSDEKPAGAQSPIENQTITNVGQQTTKDDSGNRFGSDSPASVPPLIVGTADVSSPALSATITTTSATIEDVSSANDDGRPPVQQEKKPVDQNAVVQTETMTTVATANDASDGQQTDGVTGAPLQQQAADPVRPEIVGGLDETKTPLNDDNDDDDGQVSENGTTSVPQVEVEQQSSTSGAGQQNESAANVTPATTADAQDENTNEIVDENDKNGLATTKPNENDVENVTAVQTDAATDVSSASVDVPAASTDKTNDDVSSGMTSTDVYMEVPTTEAANGPSAPVNAVPSADVPTNVVVPQQQNDDSDETSTSRLPVMNDHDNDGGISPTQGSPAQSADVNTEPNTSVENTESSAVAENTEPSIAADNTDANTAAESTEPNAAAESTEPSAAGENTEPSVVVENTKPSAVTENTVPSAAAENTEPSAAAENMEPSATADNKEPSAAADNKEPSAVVENTEPSTATENAEPSAAAENTEPSAAAENMEQSATADNKEPSAIVENTEPSTATENAEPSAAAENTEPSAAAENTEPNAVADNTEPSATAAATTDVPPSPNSPVANEINPDATSSDNGAQTRPTVLTPVDENKTATDNNAMTGQQQNGDVPDVTTVATNEIPSEIEQQSTDKPDDDVNVDVTTPMGFASGELSTNDYVPSTGLIDGQDVNGDDNQANRATTLVAPIEDTAVATTGTPYDENVRPGVPGEGTCLIDSVTYAHQAIVPKSNPCHERCECLNSIVTCTSVNCPPAPPQHRNCIPLHPGNESWCCPTYMCDGGVEGMIFDSPPDQPGAPQLISTVVLEDKPDEQENAETTEAVPATAPTVIESTVGPIIVPSEPPSYEADTTLPPNAAIVDGADGPVTVDATGETGGSSAAVTEASADDRPTDAPTAAGPVETPEDNKPADGDEPTPDNNVAKPIDDSEADVTTMVPIPVTGNDQHPHPAAGNDQQSHLVEQQTDGATTPAPIAGYEPSGPVPVDDDKTAGERPAVVNVGDVTTGDGSRPSSVDDIISSVNMVKDAVQNSLATSTSEPAEIDYQQITDAAVPAAKPSVQTPLKTAQNPQDSPAVQPQPNDTQQPATEQQQPEVEQQQPVTESQKPATEPQQPAMEPQQPEMDPQQPAAEQQQPEVEQQSVTEQQQPAMEPQQPAAEQQQPIVEQQQPEVEQQQPVTESQQPATEPQQPAMEPQQPEIDPQQPAAEQQQPEVEQQQSVTEQQQPATEQQQPATEQQQPAANESPAKPDSEHDRPTASVSSSGNNDKRFGEPSNSPSQPPSPPTPEQSSPQPASSPPTPAQPSPQPPSPPPVQPSPSPPPSIPQSTWTPKPLYQHEGTTAAEAPASQPDQGFTDEYDDENEAVYGPGTCRYGGKVYVSAQQVPRDDPCDFCFCFRGDIICLQQSCPPPIFGCYQENIQGFCCPRYECPVAQATSVNVTTTTTTTTTTVPPHFFANAYRGAARRAGCLIHGHAYRVGENVGIASGPCLECICGADGKMKCEPRPCSPEPLLRKMMAEAVSQKKRR